MIVTRASIVATRRSQDEVEGEKFHGGDGQVNNKTPIKVAAKMSSASETRACLSGIEPGENYEASAKNLSHFATSPCRWTLLSERETTRARLEPGSGGLTG